MKTDPARSFRDKTRANRNAGLTGWLKPAQDLLQFVQAVFSVALGFSTLILLSGFIIVNSYLGNVTDIHGYNVATGQYIAAGIGFYAFLSVVIVMVAGLMYIVNKAVPLVSRIRRFLAIGFAVFSVIYLMLFIVSRLLIGELSVPILLFSLIGILWYIYVIITQLTNLKSSKENTGLGTGQLLSPRILLLILISVSVLLSWLLYGNLVYGQVPRSLGGGKPATVILVLKDGSSPSQFALSPDDQSPNHTKPLWLLAELTDGLLVADLNTKRVVAVKNEVIVSIIDDQLSESLPDPTPTFTPTMTFTPTATPTATFTPVPTETATP